MTKPSRTTLSLPRRAPRNPLVAAAHARHAGSHRMPGGAQRQQERRELRTQLRHELHTLPTWHRHSP